MKRPGGKERAGGPESRTQNRQKIPCMLPMNRVEDIPIPCTVERMKKGPPRSRSLLVQKIMRARCRTRRPLSAKSIAWCSKAWGGGWGQKGQEAGHMGGAVPPAGSGVEPTSQCRWYRAGVRDSGSVPRTFVPGGSQKARGGSPRTRSFCERCAYAFVPGAYATVRAGASRWS